MTGVGRMTGTWAPRPTRIPIPPALGPFTVLAVRELRQPG
jgi:hypothetical protein